VQPVVSREIAAPIRNVWSVVANGWMYSGWVVGASRIRDVDDGFPRSGANLHQSIGPWPLIVNDVTTVVEADEPERLVLQVRSRPFGEGRVRLRLTSTSPATTRVEMDEEVTRGPLRWVPRQAQAPLVNWRNRESLRRLAHLAERGAADS
jgi:hypothetical protein